MHVLRTMKRSVLEIPSSRVSCNSVFRFSFCSARALPTPRCLLLECWFYSTVSFSSFLAAVSSITIISANSHMLMLPKYPWKSFYLSPIKRWEFSAASSLVVQAKSLGEVLQGETNVSLLCHMIQLAILALEWPWENSLDLCN